MYLLNVGNTVHIHTFAETEEQKSLYMSKLSHTRIVILTCLPALLDLGSFLILEWREMM
jgi:hypothetical protein